MKVRALLLSATAVAALGAAGCGPDSGTGAGGARHSPTATSASPTRGSASPSASASPTTGATAPAGTVRLQVTGGFVGKNDVLTVEPDGSWTFTGRTGTRHGTLSAARADRLHQLTTDPKLAAEARLRMPKHTCADGISYRLTVGSLSLTRADCGGTGTTPTFNAIVELLGKATPV